MTAAAKALAEEESMAEDADSPSGIGSMGAGPIGEPWSWEDPGWAEWSAAGYIVDGWQQWLHDDWKRTHGEAASSSSSTWERDEWSRGHHCTRSILQHLSRTFLNSILFNLIPSDAFAEGWGWV